MIPFHPLADLFPLIEGEEFEALVADLRDNGLREKILLRGGQILDGRNRYRALLAAGLVGPRLNAAQAMEKHKRFFTSCDDLSEPGAVARVVSLNLRRRHLSESQRALIAARLATLGRGRRKGAAEKASIESVAPTERDAAALLNVSRASVQRAKALVEVAPAGLVAEVAAGTVKVSRAAALLAPAQAEVLAAGGDPRDADALYDVIRARRERERLEKIAAKKDKRAARSLLGDARPQQPWAAEEQARRWQTLESERNLARQALEETRAELKRERSACEDVREELKEAKKALAAVEVECLDLRAEVAEMEKEIDGLHGVIATLNAAESQQEAAAQVPQAQEQDAPPARKRDPSPSAPPPEPVVPRASTIPAPPAPAKPSAGALARVSLTLMTVTARDGLVARFTSMQLLKLLTLLADGQRHGQERAVKASGFADFASLWRVVNGHRGQLEGIGLIIRRGDGVIMLDET